MSDFSGDVIHDAPHAVLKMSDGTIYVGISPDTGEPLFAAAEDAPGLYTHSAARAFAVTVAATGVHGHDDWRLPTKGELNLLFNERSAIGGFNRSGTIPEGSYWAETSSQSGFAWSQEFTQGRAYPIRKSALASLRCVRG